MIEFETKTILSFAIEVATAFTLLSVLISILTEMISSFSNYRALRLRHSIKVMLGASLRNAFFKHPVITKLHGLNQYKISRFFGPFHLSPKIFSEVVLDLLDGKVRGKEEPEVVANIQLALDEKRIVTTAGEVAIDDQLANILGAYLDHSGAENRLERFRDRIELWFEESGKRTSSLYSRDMKVLGVCIALIVLPFFEFDLLQYLRTNLIEDPTPLPWASGWFYQFAHLVFMAMLLSLGSETWFKFLNYFVKLRR